MAIDQIGVSAAIPQQYEEVITSSGNWSVPVGVKSVEYIVAGGGANSGSRGGVSYGIYNVDGKSTIPIIVGAEGSGTGNVGGTTTFDNAIVCTGGIYNSGTSHSTGNVVRIGIDPSQSVTGGTPISGPSDYGLASETGVMAYFAAFDGKGISISTSGNTALFTIDSGQTWNEVNSITNPDTGLATSFSSMWSAETMRMDHNGGDAWVMRREGGTYLAYTLDNGLNWWVRNLGFTFYDAIIAGDSNSNAAMVSTTGGVQRTGDLSVGTFAIASSDRVDMFFRTNANGQYFIGLDGTDSYYTYSSNNGSTWARSTSSVSQIRGGSTNRYSKSYSSYRSTSVVEQRGLNSDYITGAYQNNSNNYINWYTYYSVNYNNSAGGTSPSGNYGDNNTTTNTMFVWKPQTFNQGHYGMQVGWYQSSTRYTNNMTFNYSYANYQDGGFSGGGYSTPQLGGQGYYSVSRYIVGETVPNNNNMLLFAYSGKNDGKIYTALGYEGMGTSSGASSPTQYYSSADAMGNKTSYNWTTNYSHGMQVQASGIDGWGRNGGEMNGYGYGGAGQDGGVRLRWWA
jgi:hypothetical protein